MNIERALDLTAEAARRDSEYQAKGMAKDAGLIEELEITTGEITEYVKRRTNPSYLEGDHLILAGILKGERRERLMLHFTCVQRDVTLGVKTANTNISRVARMDLLTRKNES